MRFKKDLEGKGRVRDTRSSGGRGFSARGAGAGALLSIIPTLFRFLGLKGTVIAVIVGGGFLMMAPKGCKNSILGLISGQPQQTQTQSQSGSSKPDSAKTKQEIAFLQNMLKSTNSVWEAELGRGFVPTNIEVMNDNRGTGPYYRPDTQLIYIDPKFFVELAERHDSAGDFAHAYVLAHEAAHHVQKLLGLTTFVHSQRGNNELSVRLELYADFLAGVWAHQAVKRGDIQMEEGDIEEAVNAANNIGDDVLQKKAGAWKLDPSKFTHGTGKQRKAWLLHGFRSGNWRDCDLFAVSRDGTVSAPANYTNFMPPSR